MLNIEDPANLFFAKAARIASASRYTQAVPRSPSRAELLKHIQACRRRIRSRIDPTLTALGFSVAGLTLYYVSVCGCESGWAEILAEASKTLAGIASKSS